MLNELAYRGPVAIKHIKGWNFTSTSIDNEVGLLNMLAGQSETQIIPLAFVNLVTPKTGAKHELLFNKPASFDDS